LVYGLFYTDVTLKSRVEMVEPLYTDILSNIRVEKIKVGPLVSDRKEKETLKIRGDLFYTDIS